MSFPDLDSIYERLKLSGALEVPSNTTGGLPTLPSLGGGTELARANQPPGLARRVFGGALRGLSSTLEPLALPQDTFFSVVGGALDPNRSILENLKEQDWSAYIPFGRSPDRVVTGGDLLGLLGVENESALKWGGLAIDLTVDPLVFGSALRVGGKVGNIESLVRLGDRVDEAVSIGGMYRNLRRADPAFGARIDLMNERLLEALRNPEARVFGLSSTTAQGLVRGFLPGRTAARLNAGQLGVDVRAIGDLARQAGEDVFGDALRNIDSLETGLLAGEDGQNFLRKAWDIMRGVPLVERSIASMPSVVREAIKREGYGLVDARGLALADLGKAEEVLGDVLQGTRFADEAIESAANTFDAALERLRGVATKAGVRNVGLVETKFRDFVEGATIVEAKLGYHLSGYEIVKKRFIARATEALDGDVSEAWTLWREALGEGMNGRWSEFLNAPRDARLGRLAEDAEDVTTLRQTFGEDFEAGLGLDFGAYLNGLTNGHMRRSFGIFSSTDDFNRYIRSVDEGKLVPNNILDEEFVRVSLGTEYEDVYKHFRDYQEALSASGQSGNILTKTGILRHVAESLRREGVSAREAARRAQEGFLRIVSSAHDQDRISPLLSQLRDAASRYGALDSPQGMFGAGAFGARQNLSQETLEVLGEFADPLISLQESAKIAKSRIPVQEFVNNTYELALENGAVQKSRFTDSMGVAYRMVSENERLLGAFSGKYVHPYLYDELQRSFRARGNHAGTLERLRSLVTGGYLAAPNVIAANFIGGIYTSVAAGVSPFGMVKALAETFPNLVRNEGRGYDVLDRLRRHIDVGGGTVVTNDLASRFEKLKLDTINSPEGLRGMFNKVISLMEGQLQRPAGVGALGLNGFQFVEQWLKTASFKATLDDLSRRAITNRRFQSTDLANLGPNEIEALAAEVARISVFDYSELPEFVAFFRDYGALMFPGFPLFMMGRTVNGALNRPGKLAAADRISEAITNANLQEEERYQLYAGMPEWLREDQGVPIRVERDPNNDKRASVIPLNQLIPTRTFTGGPFAESLGTGGIYRPLMEMVYALMSDTGVAPFSQRFGQRVFNPEAEGATKWRQVASFAYNNFGPAIARKIYSPRPDQPARGLVPAAGRAIEGRLPNVPLSAELAGNIYSYDEIKSRRADRALLDEVVGTFLRSPQTIALTGPLAGVRREFTNAQRDLGEEMTSLRRQWERAMFEGNTVRAQQIANDIKARRTEFTELWGPVLSVTSGGGPAPAAPLSPGNGLPPLPESLRNPTPSGQ